MESLPAFHGVCKKELLILQHPTGEGWMRRGLGIPSLAYRTQSEPDVAAQSGACVSVSTSAPDVCSRQEEADGGVGILQIHCKSNRERQDGSPRDARGGREGAGLLCCCSLTPSLHQAPGTQRDPEHRNCLLMSAVTIELEQRWLPTLTGEAHCSCHGVKPSSAPDPLHRCHLSNRLLRSILFGTASGWAT